MNTVQRWIQWIWSFWKNPLDELMEKVRNTRTPLPLRKHAFFMNITDAMFVELRTPARQQDLLYLVKLLNTPELTALPTPVLPHPPSPTQI